MARKPLSNVDTAWLRMEDPTNLMMISGVLVFSTPIDFERLKATLEHRLLRWERFRQRVVHPVSPLGSLCWEEDPDFDLNYHLQRVTLPPPGDQAALQELASLLASTQLDFRRPLWQFHLIEGYGTGSALFVRLHHCIGDGIVLVQILLSATDTSPDAPWPAAKPRPPRPGQSPLRALTRPARSALKLTGRAAAALLHEGMATVRHPAHGLELARVGIRGTKALGRLLFILPDPKTVYKGPLSVAKRVAWSEPLPLPDVKAVGRALGGTVNDVLLTAMTGGLRRYLQGRGEAVDGLNFRAVVPVNLRPLDSEPDLGNRFGLVFLSLPVGIADPAQRLQELKRRMDGLKGSLEAPVAFGILNAIGMVPQPVQDLVVTLFGLKGTAVMTNVMGPKEPIYLAGAPLEALMFWVPQSGHLGMGVSILSYNNRVFMGVITDQGLVPDPDTIIAAFQAEFEELVAVVPHGKVPQPSQAAMATREKGQLSRAAPVPENPAVPAAREPAVCQALTREGQPCKNRPLPGSSYCRTHQPK